MPAPCLSVPCWLQGGGAVWAGAGPAVRPALTKSLPWYSLPGFGQVTKPPSPVSRMGQKSFPLTSWGSCGLEGQLKEGLVIITKCCVHAVGAAETHSWNAGVHEQWALLP